MHATLTPTLPPQSDTPAQPEQPPISWLGGMGYDEAKNQHALDYFRDLGHPVVSALTDRNLDGAPKGYWIVTASSTRIVPRVVAYTQTAKPEVTLIASRQEEARADELIAHIEAEGKGPVTHFGQSADAQNAVLAAHKRPDLFKNVILLFPTGMIRKKYRTEYLREAGHLLRDRSDKVPKAVNPPDNDFEAALRPTTLRKKIEAAKRLKRSGGYAVAASGIAATNNYLLNDLRQKEDAPGFAMVLGLHDKIGRPERFLESLVSANDVDYILITNTAHGTNGRKDLINELLALEAKLNARNAERKAAQTRGESFNPGPLSERLLFLADVPEAEQARLRTLARNVPDSVNQKFR